MVADRWSPVTVWITSPEKAVDGVVVISYAQDASHNAVIRAPFATTPGQTTPVELLACIPQYCSEVTVTVAPRGGRPRTTRYVPNPLPDEARLPWMLLPGALAVQVGESSFVSISAGDDDRPVEPEEPVTSADQARRLGQQSNRQPDEHELWLENIAVSRIQPGALPRSWAAYDGLIAVVAGGDDAAQADPTERDQLHRWVRAGGRLIVQLGATDDWRLWLPPESADLARADPLTAAPPPPELSAALQRGAEAMQLQVPAVSPTVPSRRLTLSPDAAERGWSVRWQASGGGLIAEGPVGFGWVTLVGVDPKRVTEHVSNASAGILWRDAVSIAAADHLERLAREHFAGYAYGAGSEQSALIAALSELADMPPVGDGVFLAIVLGVAGMAILLGPFDAIVLKRLRQRHRSWLTALLWIGLASALAYTLPAMMRDGDTRLNTLEVVDLLPEEHRAGAAGYSTLLTGVFASRSGRMELQGAPAPSLWRGASPLMEYETTGGLSWTFATSQSARRDDAGWPRGNPMESVGASIWTFRTFQSKAPVSGPLAELGFELTLGDWPRVIVRNLPDGAEISSAVLRTERGWTPLGSPTPYQDGLSLETTLSFPVLDPPQGWAPSTNDTYYWAHRHNVAYRPGVAIELDGPSARTHAIAHAVRRGDFACIYLDVDNLPAPLDIAGWQTIGTHRAVVRALIPLPLGSQEPEQQTFEDAPPIEDAP